MDDWRITFELIGAIGVLFNMFIDWPKFMKRIREIRHIETPTKPPLPLGEKNLQAPTFSNLAISTVLFIILIVSSASLTGDLDSFSFGQLGAIFIGMIVVLFVALILIRRQLFFNNLLISVGVALIYFYGYSYFTHPGWVSLSLPISGDQNAGFYIEYYKWLPYNGFDCVLYPVNVWYSGQSSSHVRFEYEESSYSFVGENCEPISNEWEFTPNSGHFWFYLIPKFAGETHQATLVYLSNISDNSLLSNEPIEIFIENRFYSIVRQVFPFYFVALLIIYFMGRKKKTA